MKPVTLFLVLFAPIWVPAVFICIVLSAPFVYLIDVLEDNKWKSPWRFAKENYELLFK